RFKPPAYLGKHSPAIGHMFNDLRENDHIHIVIRLPVVFCRKCCVRKSASGRSQLDGWGMRINPVDLMSQGSERERDIPVATTYVKNPELPVSESSIHQPDQRAHSVAVQRASGICRMGHP